MKRVIGVTAALIALAIPAAASASARYEEHVIRPGTTRLFYCEAGYNLVGFETRALRAHRDRDHGGHFLTQTRIEVRPGSAIYLSYYQRRVLVTEASSDWRTVTNHGASAVDYRDRC